MVEYKKIMLVAFTYMFVSDPDFVNDVNVGVICRSSHGKAM
jgi:hypothetical protein